MAEREAVPGAVTTACPDCGEETLHTVLHGTASAKGATYTVDATVQCSDCERVHHAIVRTAREIEVPAVVSTGGQSRRSVVSLPADEGISVGEAVVVDGVNCKVTGIEAKDLRRVDAAEVNEVQTLWVKEFEELNVGVAINMGHKTIVKHLPAKPEDEFSVGQEMLFGRLRVTVHAIKTEERLLKRGSAEAAEIVRVFAKPTPLAPKAYRPPKDQREQLREREERKAARKAARGRRE